MIPLAVVAGCGRIAFDPLSDVGTTPARCSLTATFTSIRKLDELSEPTVIDGALRLSPDERIAYFHRMNPTFDIMVSTRADRSLPFDPPTVLLATAGSEWPTVSADGLTLVYEAGTDLLVSTRATATAAFAQGTVLSAVSTAAAERTPILSSDERHLYFVRDGAPNEPYVAPWPGAATSTSLAELSATNLLQSPTPSADELGLYFSEDDGTGHYRILLTTRAAVTDPFGAATPVPELALGTEDSPTWLSPDQCRLYFESTRDGDFDLYVAERQLP